MDITKSRMLQYSLSPAVFDYHNFRLKLPKETIGATKKEVDEIMSKLKDESEEIDAPSKWEWWRVKGGNWVNLSAQSKMEWLTGSLDEMAIEYGVHCERPVMKKEDGDISVTVYGLIAPFITQDVKNELEKYHQLSVLVRNNICDLRADNMIDSWDSDSPIEWLYFFEDVYPSSHLVYVHYSFNVEGYGVFCETYKDMLDTVNLVLGSS